ncbi:TetR/AcrR family transcriptional regulator [Agromyces mediolanus]|uniref:TetR/AcrR family transcriptional regulator n=1 Tax=Agromyces mediolanus TaxID=41986 RepID=UPI003838D284
MPAAPRTRGRPPGLAGPALLAEARAVFLERGYAATTMDEIAARARISKSSLYREHPSKSELFAAVVADWAASGRDATRPMLERLTAAAEPREGLAELGHGMLRGMLSPPVVEMRRLVITEAKVQPEVAAAYRRDSWERNVDALAAAFGELHRAGSLTVGDARAAAAEFTWLVVGAPLNSALLGERFDGLDAHVTSAVATFLARYGAPSR